MRLAPGLMFGVARPSVPVAFLYAREETVAELLLLWHSAPAAAKQQAIAALTR